MAEFVIADGRLASCVAIRQLPSDALNVWRAEGIAALACRWCDAETPRSPLNPRSFKVFQPNTYPVRVSLLNSAIRPGNQCTLCIFGA